MVYELKKNNESINYDAQVKKLEIIKLIPILLD